MFTGLVETVGRVARAEGRSGGRLLTLEAGFSSELAVGESVAVNGVCLTVTSAGRGSFSAEAVKTTLDATTLGRLRVGDAVNLERALAVGDRLGGHVVQGHVDEVGKVRRITRRSGYWVLAASISRRNSALLVDKGSVSVNGVSLTVAGARPGEFSVNVIPHTWDNTNLGTLRPGSLVNIEYDILVKAAQRLVDYGMAQP
jgi:riboflavin synthase